MTTTITKSIEKDDYKSLLGEDNPIIIRDEILEAAHAYILKAAMKVAKEKELDKKEMAYLISLVRRAYRVRKAKYFFEAKSSQLNLATLLI